LVSGLASSVSHGVEGDPASVAPSISALVPVLKAKRQGMQQIPEAAAAILLLKEQMWKHQASGCLGFEQYSEIKEKLLPDADRKLAHLQKQDAALSLQLTSARLACYYLSCRGFFLNYYRLLGLLVLMLGGCLLALNLLTSAEPHDVPLSVISAEEEESASTSAYVMLKKHCKHVPSGKRQSPSPLAHCTCHPALNSSNCASQ
jgi:hypothetical protein